MNITYSVLSKFYDLIDVIYFTKKGINPRKAILDLIPDTNIQLLDMCCGTMSNSIGIAKKRRDSNILGIDLSAEMLTIAKNKIQKEQLHNIKTRKCDAKDTKLPTGYFDYVIIALVLHETEDRLAREILNEAERILKADGRLLVLEWEQPETLLKKIMFWTVKMLEPKPFKSFIKTNKEEYFQSRGYDMMGIYHCDYSCVYELKKQS